MIQQGTKPKIYLKISCPFCLKLYIFLSEAGLVRQFDLITFDDGDDTHQALRKQMEDNGQPVSFPAAELSPGELTTETDQLIARFADQARADTTTMPLLNFYSDGVFKQHLKMFRELRDSKSAKSA